MKVFIKVVAIDEVNGIKSTSKKKVEVSESVVKLHEALAKGDDEELLRLVGASVLAAAVREIKISKGSRIDTTLMESATGQVSGSKLESMLGLDIIRAQNQRDRHSAPTRSPVQSQHESGPGMPGFPKR